MRNFNKNFPNISTNSHDLEDIQFPLIKLSVEEILNKLYDLIKNNNNQNVEGDFIDIKQSLLKLLQGFDEQREMAGFIFLDMLEIFVGPINAINFGYQIKEVLTSKKLKNSF